MRTHCQFLFQHKKMKWLSNNNFMTSVILSVNTQKLEMSIFSGYCSSIDLQAISWDKNNVTGDLKWAVVSVAISSLVIYWRRKTHFNLSSHNKKFLVTEVFKNHYRTVENHVSKKKKNGVDSKEDLDHKRSPKHIQTCTWYKYPHTCVHTYTV